MKRQIVLDQEDIQQALANAYNTDIKNVRIEVIIEFEGIGRGEHPVHKAKATIDETDKGQYP